MQCGFIQETRHPLSWRGALVILVGVVVYGSGPLAAQPAMPASAHDTAYARYATPGMCKYAAQRMDRFYWREKRPDTVRYAPATDSVPTLARQTAQACVARFTVAAVKERELIELVRLYLLAQQDSLAQTAVERALRMTAQQSPRERGWMLLKVVRAFLRARPTRLDQARRYVAALDALGPPAALWRLFAHNELSTYAYQVNALPSAIAAGNAAMKARAEMSQNEQIDWTGEINDTYGPLADAISIVHGGPAAVAVLDRAIAELTPLGRAIQDLQPLLPGQRPGSVWLLEAIKGRKGPYAFMGAPAPPLHATFHYTSGATPRSDTTTRPRLGEVTLLVFMHRWTCWSSRGECFGMYATLKRLHEKYGNAGLRIVLQTETAGSFRTQLAEDSVHEAELMRGYLHDYVRLPGTVAIQSIGYTFRPAPDGRREYGPNPNTGLYSGGEHAGVLTDHQGRVRLNIVVGPATEQVLGAVIAATLKAAGQCGGTIPCQ